MPTYLVFGGCLQSSITFPQLPGCDLEPQWRLETVCAPPSATVIEALGTDSVNASVRVRLDRTRSGFRLSYDDSGIFDVSRDGGTITWARGAAADPRSVRADVMGRVLALAMHASGRLCLHGSAVSLRSGVVGFLAPKHHGKSTLALAAVRRGARLVTDDSLPVDLGPPAVASPGVHDVRLWGDSLGRLGDGVSTVDDIGGKQLLDGLPQASVENEARPLTALYLLAPRPAAKGSEPARRERLAPVVASLGIVRHAKIGALLRGSEAPVLLERAAALAREVPVYVLQVLRDFDVLDAVVEQIVAWADDDADSAPRRPSPKST